MRIGGLMYVASLSTEGRSLSAYNAAHAAALTALRSHGYRSENRYMVFQRLTHTLNWPAARFGCCHQRTDGNTAVHRRLVICPDGVRLHTSSGIAVCFGRPVLPGRGHFADFSIE